MCCLLLFYPRDKDHEFYNSATEIVKKDPPQPQRTHITSETLIPSTMHWSFTTYHWPITQSISDGKICQGKSFLAWSQWCFPWLPIWASLRLYTNLTSALVVISWGSHGFPDSPDSQYLTIKWDTFNQKTITGCKNERMNLCSESKNQRFIIQCI